MIRIFVEGRDSEFLDKYLLFLFGENKGMWEIIQAGGYSKLHLLDQQFKENTERGGVNLIIFDADSADNGGGYIVRKSYLQERLEHWYQRIILCLAVLLLSCFLLDLAEIEHT